MKSFCKKVRPVFQTHSFGNRDTQFPTTILVTILPSEAIFVAAYDVTNMWFSVEINFGMSQKRSDAFNCPRCTTDKQSHDSPVSRAVVLCVNLSS